MSTKKILGLDIGVSSVGLAVIEDIDGQKEIKDLAVRVVPEDPNFQGKFYSGNTASKNLDRTIDRGIRRNNQRFKARRDQLIATLKKHEMYDESLINIPALELYGLRANAVTDQISLKEFGRILIHLNQRRGFLSNRKSNSEEEDSTDYKKRIAELENVLDDKTIGQQLFKELQSVSHPLEILLRERTYLRKTYIEEFDRIWDKQKTFYPTLLTGGCNEDDNKGTLYDLLRNKIIYYQRPLKSQKGLVSECPFEKHHKAVSRSSPYFELFRIWQKVNDLSWKTPDGQSHEPSEENKQLLKDKLWEGVEIKSRYKLTISKIKEVLGYKRNDKVYLNFPELDGSKTYAMIRDALHAAKIENPNQYLFFHPEENDEKGGLFELWHITYSLPTQQEVVNALVKHFKFTEDQSTIIAKNVGYNFEYGSLSTRAIRKLLPHMQNGLGYSDACDKVGYDHSGYKTKIELQSKLGTLQPNSLRNPVVEQVLNQVVNIVNQAMEKYGKFDEIRVELARELRNSADNRKRMSQRNRNNRAVNDKIRSTLRDEYGYRVVNGRDVKRYKLWDQTEKQCLYCSKPIKNTDLINGNADIEHILPKSRSFSNHMNNFILAHRACNANKGQRTAYDFMESQGEEKLAQYIELANKLYAEGKGTINKAKFDNLMCQGDKIPTDFVERMKKDTQYISKQSVRLLRTVCENTYTTTGQITDLLREEWGLKHLLEEITFDKYKAVGLTEIKEYKDSEGNIKTREIIKDWSKRDDHRHHAVDALITALTDQKIIFKLNNLNKIYQFERDALTNEELVKFEEELEGGRFNLKEFIDQAAYEFPLPIAQLRSEAKKHLESIFVSIKKSSKAISKSINRPKHAPEQVAWTPRGRIHEETVMGRVKRIGSKPVKLDKKFNQADNIVIPPLQALIMEHLNKYGNDPAKAFATNTLKERPILYKNEEVKAVKVFEESCTKRVPLSENFTTTQVLKITDKKAREVVQQRIVEHGNIKKALSNLEENPIWLNKERGIKIKAVTVYDESKVERVRNGYVKTGGNHHALIYKNELGKYIDKVVSFWVAIEIGLLNIQETGKPYPIINRSDDPEFGTFQFSMQINDLFVFDLKHSEKPQEENELDYLNPDNRPLISRRLFRVQKMSKKGNGSFDIHFRHHLESSVDRSVPELTWINIQSNKQLSRLTKIRINHLGEIIKVGE